MKHARKLTMENDLQKKITISFVVWGEDYTELFTDLILPAYFSKGNVPALSEEWDISFNIATDEISKRKILDSQIYHKVEDFAATSFCIFDPLKADTTKYQKVSFLHNQMIESCIAEKRVAVIAYPDVLISDGSLVNAVNELVGVVKIIKYPAHYRSNRDQVKKILFPLVDKKSCSLTVSSFELAKIGFDCIHEDSKSQFITSKKQNSCKSITFFRAGSIVLARSVHLHPYIIDCRVLSLKQSINEVSIDNGASLCFGCNKENIRILTDSRVFGAIELSGSDYRVRFDQRKYRSPFYSFIYHLIWVAFVANRSQKKDFLNTIFWTYLDEQACQIEKRVSYYFLKPRMYFYCINSVVFPFLIIRKASRAIIRFLIRVLDFLGWKEPTKKILKSLYLR